MRTNLVYDLPTRIFHWTFGFLFLAAFIIGKTVDDESIVFNYHMLMGLLMGSLIVLRIIWGIYGSKHAKFKNFSLNPMELKNYLMGILSGSKKLWAGHNPASSWVAIIMLALGLGLSITGYLMTTGLKEELEDFHELMANSFIILVIFHVLGIIIHTVRHRDMIALSMVDGKKTINDSNQSIPSSHPLPALILVGFICGAGFYLYNSFNQQEKTLKVFGQTLQLGESEGESHQNEDLDDSHDE